MDIEVEKPKIVGTKHIVICVKCWLLQTWDQVEKEGHCAREKNLRGWGKCPSIEFCDIK